MTSYPSQNEGFRLLDELVCQAVLAPTVQDVQNNSAAESRGENEGIRVCEPISTDTVGSSPNTSSNVGSVPVGGDANDILIGSDGSNVVISHSTDVDVLVGGFQSDRLRGSEPGHAPDLLDRAVGELCSAFGLLSLIRREVSNELGLDLEKEFERAEERFRAEWVNKSDEQRCEMAIEHLARCRAKIEVASQLFASCFNVQERKRDAV